MYKVLIVEDDPTIAGIVAEHLGKWGYETKKVSDFEKVMEEFGAFQPISFCWTIGLPFSTAIIGAAKFGLFPGCLLCFFPRRMII